MKATTQVHVVEIQPTKATASGQRYAASYQGEVIVVSSREPEFAAARALASRGLGGIMATRHPGSDVDRMRLNIETTAKLSIAENANYGPRLTKYKPHPGFDDE